MLRRLSYLGSGAWGPLRDYGWTSSAIEPLLRSTLVLVAHPDDETVGCGILLQRIADLSILLCTDGAPARDQPWYSKVLYSRKHYGGKRLAEFRAALRVAGARHVYKTIGIQDQMLYRSLEQAAVFIGQFIVKHRPDAILSHAFEAGHPDHDSCAFLAHWAGRKFSLPVWEMPLYHKTSPSSPLVYQQFLRSDGNEVVLCPAPEELRRKRMMLSMHRSQAAVLSKVDGTREVFRPQQVSDFTVNPNPALSTFAVCDNVTIAGALESFRSFPG
jgi:LmbE family N-acetylglucosaminyl deacetylase